MTNKDSGALSGILASYRARVNQALDQYLPPPRIQPATLHEAMRYAVFNGGKRIRASLVYATGHAIGALLPALDAPACAVELIHAYSLVHDDLPAMDDDDLRRGEPTCHRAFDEATAILAGDALQSLAFYALSHAPATNHPQHRIEMIGELAQASGSRGMAGGQALDLAAEGKDLNLAELENLHIHKTGALIRASVKLGGLSCPDVDRGRLEQLDHYAKCIGLAFQIRDDILDVEGDTEVLGKPKGSDAARNKSTYPSLVGLTAAKQMASELVQQAIERLQDFSSAADPLRWLASYVVARSS